MSEHRRFTRIPFDAATQVTQDNDAWPVDLLDISLNGVLFKQPENWKINPGKPMLIDITIADKTKIKMEARLVHITTDEAGCKCIHIDLDSITVLKRLIELNLGDDTFLERELSSLIQYHED
ncbi:MAG: hypothetical protein ACI843_002239 [Psychrobacter glaciei]|jgi:hypothetical protein